MANPAPQVSVHWLAYTVFAFAIISICWLWHDTQLKDEAKLAAIATQAKQSQQVSDKQVVAATNDAQTQLKQQNQQLQSQLNAARTLAQQIALINQQAGTKIQSAPQGSTDDLKGTIPPGDKSLPQAPQAVISGPDIKAIAQDETDLAECKNQTAADQVQIAGDKTQIQSRDTEISADDKQIGQLKGGSHLKRFLSAAKYVLIGAGTTAAIIGIKSIK